MEKKSGLGKFILGALAGAAAGVLLTPKTGKEMRNDVKEGFEDLIAKIKKIDANEVKDSFTKKIDEIKNEVSDLDKEKVLEIAKEKANDIKEKLDDLVEEAKAKATPVIQKSVNDVRSKTIIVLKDTIKKLENNKEDSKKASKK